eukprot:7246565-Prymnesium_polylepis.2
MRSVGIQGRDAQARKWRANGVIESCLCMCISDRIQELRPPEKFGHLPSIDDDYHRVRSGHETAQ